MRILCWPARGREDKRARSPNRYPDGALYDDPPPLAYRLVAAEAAVRAAGRMSVVVVPIMVVASWEGMVARDCRLIGCAYERVGHYATARLSELSEWDRAAPIQRTNLTLGAN
jgi:hypothetical protein